MQKKRFSDSESHTLFINASTKKFTLVNNAIPSYDIAIEHLLYNRLASPILRSLHIANNYRNLSRYNIQYQFISNPDIALLLVVNCKFDIIIIDRTLWTLCNYMT